MISRTKKKRVASLSLVLAGVLLLSLNVNATPMATASVQTQGLFATSTPVFEDITSCTGSDTLSDDRAVTDSSWLEDGAADALEEAWIAYLLTANPSQAIKACDVFYTAADYKEVKLPKVSVVKNALLHMGPSSSSTVITNFNPTVTATILYQYNEDWFYVEMADTWRGYVAAENVSLGKITQEQIDQVTLVNKCRYGALIKSTITLRAEASSSAKSLGKATAGTLLEVTDYLDNGWVQVNSSKGTAYINSSNVSFALYVEGEVDEEGYIKEVRARLKAEAEEAARKKQQQLLQQQMQQQQQNSSKENTTELGLSIVKLAKQYLGVPYKYGGADPRGFDCSGLIYYLYKQHGMSIPRGATSQYKAANKISMNELQPGDLVFYSSDTSNSIQHVVLYIGNGQILHAPRTGTVVQIGSLYDSWRVRNYYGSASFLHN